MNSFFLTSSTMSKNIKDFAHTFFEKLEVSINSLTVVPETNCYKILLDSDDSSILIGTQGANIYALQRIMNMMLNNVEKNNDATVIKLEINGYLETKEKKLFDFIDKKISQLINKGDTIKLPKYTSYERKKIHSYIAKNHPTIKSSSQGEGEDRRMIITKHISTPNKLSIDIDSDTI